MKLLQLTFLFFVMVLNVVSAGNAQVRVEDYLEEAKLLNERKDQYLTEDQLKEGITDYGKSPEEFEAQDLKGKSREKFASSISKMASGNNEGDIVASGIIRESHAKRQRFNHLDKEKWHKKSELITENPLIGVKSDCSISGNENINLELKPEPYEVEVSNTRLIETEESCEEDAKEQYACNRYLKLSCKRGGKRLGAQEKKTYTLDWLDLRHSNGHWWFWTHQGAYTVWNHIKINEPGIVQEIRSHITNSLINDHGYSIEQIGQDMVIAESGYEELWPGKGTKKHVRYFSVSYNFKPWVSTCEEWQDEWSEECLLN